MGCRILQEAINSRNKPVVAFCNDFVASAAYGIASCCDKIVANSNVCRIGSVGTYMTIVDTSEYYAKMGIKLIDIYASKSTDKNQEFQKALQGETGKMVTCSRLSGPGYELEYGLTEVGNVCNREKSFPVEWITAEGSDIGPEFLDYALPLIQGQPDHIMENGLPKYLCRK